MKNNKKWELNNISINRGIIMGIATIMIMFFHSTLLDFSAIIPAPSVVSLITTMQSRCNCAVDIFLIVSGIGLYFSLSNDGSLKSFYKKRACRILPPMIIVLAIMYGFFKSVTLVEFFRNIFGFGLLAENTNYWYFTLIIILYALFPIIFKIIKRFDFWGMLAVVVLVIAFNTILRLTCEDIYGQFEIALTRIPSFVVGTYLGKKAYEETKLPMVSVLIAAVVFVLDLVLLVSTEHEWTFSFTNIFPGIWYPYRYLGALLALSLVFIIAYLCSVFKKNDGLIRRIFKWLGFYSLEIYLIYEHYSYAIIPKMSIDDASNISKYFVMFVITIIASYLVKKITDEICTRVFRLQGSRK